MRMQRPTPGVGPRGGLVHRLLALVAVAVALALTTACSSSSSSADSGGAGNDSGEDAAQAGDGGADAGDATIMESSIGDVTVMEGSIADSTVADAPSEGGAGDDASDGSVGDANEGGEAGPVEPSLWLTGDFLVEGVTSDNYVAYLDRSTQTYYVRALAGGASTALYTPPSTYVGSYAFVQGKVLYILAYGNGFLGTVLTWTSAQTQAAVLTNQALVFRYQTVWWSDDSQFVVWLQDSNGTGTISDIYAGKPDGTGATLLVSNVNTYYGALSCFPRVALRGGYAVVSYCTAADAGSVPIIQAFAIGNGWAPGVEIDHWIDQYRQNNSARDPSAFPFAVDPDGGRVIAASSTSGDASLQVFSIDGGAGAVLDPSWQLNPTLSFAGSKSNPWFVFYNTDAGALEQTPVANPSPQTLLDGGVRSFDAFSRDGKWMLTSSALNPNGFFADVSVVSTTSPGVSHLIYTSAQSSGMPVNMPNAANAAFTTDLNYAIVYTDNTKNNEGNWLFNARATSLSGSFATSVISTGYATDTRPLAGSKILVLDDFVEADSGAGNTSVDIHVADPSTGAPPKLVASGANGTYNVTSDLSTVVYAVRNVGIYTSALP
jgi:hypothetical protein